MNRRRPGRRPWPDSQRPRRSRMVLLVLVLCTVALIIVDAVTGPGGMVDRIRTNAGSVFGPINQVVGSVSRSLSGAGRGLTGGTQDELDRLRRENDQLRWLVQANAEDRRRIAEFDALLGTAGLGRYEIVPARVVGWSDASAVKRVVTLDAGRRDGIATDRTVLSGRGLVGRVIQVTETTCEVLLLTDPSLAVGVRVEGSGLIGLATGAGDARLDLRLLDARTSVANGARLVTVGSAGGKPFVPGVPVGQVEQTRTEPGTLARTGSIVPFASPATLDLVGIVISPPATDPRESLLPPRPASTPEPARPSPFAPDTSPASTKARADLSGVLGTSGTGVNRRDSAGSTD
ncbi:MAG: rod shape-determining protein MreC [Actinomycetota bacterium]